MNFFFILCKYLDFVNINSKKGAQRKNVINNEDMSSLRAPRQNGPYKNNTQNNTKHVEHQYATDI